MRPVAAPKRLSKYHEGTKSLLWCFRCTQKVSQGTTRVVSMSKKSFWDYQSQNMISCISRLRIETSPRDATDKINTRSTSSKNAERNLRTESATTYHIVPITLSPHFPVTPFLADKLHIKIHPPPPPPSPFLRSFRQPRGRPVLPFAPFRPHPDQHGSSPAFPPPATTLLSRVASHLLNPASSPLPRSVGVSLT